MLIRWFFSSTIRKAVDLRRHANRLLNEQRDLLSAPAITAMAQATTDLSLAIQSNQPAAQLEEEMNRLVASAEKWLIPFPNATVRENVKEFLVAGTVIIAFTTFFLQLTKIPTGSMQPTLYGIHVEEDLRNRPDVQIPSMMTRLFEYWVHGSSFIEMIATSDCVLNAIEPPQTVFPFIKRQRFLLGDEWRSVWFVQEDLGGRSRPELGLETGKSYRKGQPIIRAKIGTGDHLLVDRFTYNFRRPQRGEIIVFKTDGIPTLDYSNKGVLFIKRMVAQGGDTVRIGDDHHLVINNHRLDAATPHFENVYSFDPGLLERFGYFGHVNEDTAARWGISFSFKFFKDAKSEMQVPLRGYLAMGDNTLNSLDSRAWGALPQENVIGRHWFVYWPISPRFGWGQR